MFLLSAQEGRFIDELPHIHQHQNVSLKSSLFFRQVCCEVSAETSPEGCSYHLRGQQVYI